MFPTPEKAEILERYVSAVDLVPVIARRVRRAAGAAVSIAELESCGTEGLLDAARRFEANRQIPFRSYAYIRIRGAMLDGVRAIMPLPRRTWEKLRGQEAMDRVSASFTEDAASCRQPEPDSGEPRHAERTSEERSKLADCLLAEHLAAMATAMAVGMLARPAIGELGEPTLSEGEDDPEQATLRAEQLRHLELAIGELPPEEALLVRQHYFEGQRFNLVAERLGLSKSWASRLHRKAMERLARRMRDV